MGSCCSCLGGNESKHEPDETEPLLYDDVSVSLSQGDYSEHVAVDSHDYDHVPDPIETKRQDEALARICSVAQDELIDILHQDSYSRDATSEADFPSIINKILVARDHDVQGHLSNGVHSPTPPPPETQEEDEASWIRAAQVDVEARTDDNSALEALDLVVALERPPGRNDGSVPRPNRS